MGAAVVAETALSLDEIFVSLVHPRTSGLRGTQSAYQLPASTSESSPAAS
jgi:hypothetical protein